MIRQHAPAKLNLTLNVLGRRADGYHEVRTVLQTVSLFDELTFAPAADLRFTCSDPRLAGPDNLVLRAARLLQQQAGVAAGAAIHLLKRIPVASGLGGGSSDAAAALLGLSRLWGLEYSREQLQPLAAQLGSDVPFFLWGGTALAEGRGERITPLRPLRELWFVLLPASAAAPEKTKQLFAALTPEDYSAGDATERLLAQLRDGTVDPAAFANDMTAAACRLFPAVRAAFAALDRLGARPHLSGAGPSVFAATVDREEAARWAAALHAAGVPALLVEPVSTVR
ncbi:MAG: 4-(cytidine 5'-diphospho)-2-C-methyl-D-erythritol kinase [Chloroflexota bacterium]|nr:4-(cytidine 5'-diphospho)-2-C-methyl-D-erythritol kinase [Dehalococcoidia bacterium]MDW8253415.1 4-(cytidine 5'-diphospho)-2-C-methyl-D-erythritol kinase [Chloroflexota bacterium]